MQAPLFDEEPILTQDIVPNASRDAAAIDAKKQKRNRILKIILIGALAVGVIAGGYFLMAELAHECTEYCLH